MSSAKLEARVKAVNKANAYALELYNTLVPIFEPLVGTQILKVDGTLMQKVKNKLPELPNTAWLSVHRMSSSYSLTYVVKVTEYVKSEIAHHSDHHISSETYVQIGELKDGTLEKMAAACNSRGRTDYTAEEVEAKRAAYVEAKKALDAAQSALCPFDQYDR